MQTRGRSQQSQESSFSSVSEFDEDEESQKLRMQQYAIKEYSARSEKELKNAVRKVDELNIYYQDAVKQGKGAEQRLIVRTEASRAFRKEVKGLEQKVADLTHELGTPWLHGTNRHEAMGQDQAVSAEAHQQSEES